MASPTIKSTYSLDVETVRALERTARRWKVTKSEALRRAIRAAETAPGADDPLRVLDELQSSLDLSPAASRTWVRSVRRERAATSQRSRSARE
jgi:ribbon-helix-helix CopG family protein